MPRTDAEKKARRNYMKKCRRLQITLYPTESALIEKVDSVESYSDYIKSLIYKDIHKESRG